MSRIEEDFAVRPVFADLARVHDRDPVRHVSDDPQVMGNEDNGHMVDGFELIDQFEDLGLKQSETTSFDNGIVKEQTIEYVFEGSYDSYLMLRRASLAMLDVLNDSDEFRIVIHGKNKI